MTTEIVQVQNPQLKNFIQYFIFFRSEKNETVSYTTFPNTNLCLAIYKNNAVRLHRNDYENRCLVLPGTTTYSSLLLGFHKSVFEVNANAPIDEVCIIFHPSALKMFTNIPYTDMQESDNVFQMVFPDCDRFFLEQLFEQKNNLKRASSLEELLLRSIKTGFYSDKMKQALYAIQNNKGENLEVATIAEQLSVNESTLYRLFMSQLGQSPKPFLKTLRFRHALNGILNRNGTRLTDLAYDSHYMDQSHFIREFKSITGLTPGQIKTNARTEQETLTWIYRED